MAERIVDFTATGTTHVTSSTSQALYGYYGSFEYSVNVEAFYSILCNLPDDRCIVTGYFSTSTTSTFSILLRTSEGCYKQCRATSSVYNSQMDWSGIKRISDFTIVEEIGPLRYFTDPWSICYVVFDNLFNAAAYAKENSVNTCYIAGCEDSTIMFNIVSYTSGEVSGSFTSTEHFFYDARTCASKYYFTYITAIEPLTYYKIDVDTSAPYKLINADKLDSALTATADAIRAKTGGTDVIVFSVETGFAEAISTIVTSEDLPSAEEASF